jgi:serine/threonine protein kinase
VLLGVSVGDILDGKFAVERHIGHGGMGMVLAVRHVVLGERFAMKILFAPTDEVLRERLVREARAARRLKSAHAARVHAAGVLPGGEPYLIMDLLDGRDLRTMVGEDGPLPVPLAVDYLLQACDAIVDAHALGIVHRDIKPANLFATRRAGGPPMIKLLDFGIAKLGFRATMGPSSLAHNAALLGSAQFMAPEQLASRRDVDARANVWSLGATLFELLTGEVPFAGDDVGVVFRAVLRDPPRSLRAIRPEVPQELERIVLRCLEKHPDERYASVAKLAAALAPFARSTTPSVERISSHPVAPTVANPSASNERTDLAKARPVRTVMPAAHHPRSRSRWLVAAVVIAGAATVFGWLRLRPADASRSSERRGASPRSAGPKAASSGYPLERYEADDLNLAVEERNELRDLTRVAQGLRASGRYTGAADTAQRVLERLQKALGRARGRSRLGALAGQTRGESLAQLADRGEADRGTAIDAFKLSAQWDPNGETCAHARALQQNEILATSQSDEVVAQQIRDAAAAIAEDYLKEGLVEDCRSSVAEQKHILEKALGR